MIERLDPRQPEVSDDDAFSGYEGWTPEPPQPEKIYPHEFTLSEEALESKRILEANLRQMLADLQSPEVLSKDYAAPGGEAAIIEEMRGLQLTELPKIYADVEYETPDYLRTHHQQTDATSCQFACAADGMNALGVLDNPVSEDELKEDFFEEMHYRGTPFPDHIAEFIRGQGFDVQKLTTMTSILDALIAGSKVTFGPHNPPHALLASGVRISHGKIEFLINDPSPAESGFAVPVPLEKAFNFVDLSRYGKIGGLAYAISAPPNATPPLADLLNYA